MTGSEEEPPVVISLHDVCVDRGHERVIDNIHLDIRQGEFVGIVGPNGGGKTTMVRAALGLLPVSCGEVHLMGTPIERFRDWDRIGYVAQHAVHVDQRFPASVEEVVLMGRAGRRGLFRTYNDEDRRKAHEALEAVGVADLAHRRIGALSGGQRQRVFLAQALAREPDLLILDEPTTGVDPDARESFYDLLDHLNHDDGLTVILITHDNQAVSLVAHRMIALNRAVVYDGAPAAFEEKGGYGAAYGIELHHHAHEPPQDIPPAESQKGVL